MNTERVGEPQRMQARTAPKPPGPTEAPDARGKILVEGVEYQLIRIGAVPPWMKPYRPGVSSYDGLYELAMGRGRDRASD